MVVLAPANAPAWVQTPELWQRVEASEIRKNSQTAREINIALPVELSPEQRRGLLLGYCQAQFVGRGMIADVSFHDNDSNNPHAHIMLTTRQITPEGFGQKVREWNDRLLLAEWREQWQEHANRALEQAGHEMRIDHRTLEAQQVEAVEQGRKADAIRLDRGATVHQGYKTGERIQGENRAAAQELAEAQARAAAWEQAHPEVVAAMQQRAEQERVRREEAEKDRAWGGLAASAVADTKSKHDTAAQQEQAAREQADERRGAERQALSEAADAYQWKVQAEERKGTAKAERQRWGQAHPWRMMLDAWGWKSGRLAALVDEPRAARLDLKEASAAKAITYWTLDVRKSELYQAMTKEAAAIKATERARVAYEQARERLAEIEAGTRTRQMEEATRRTWDRAEQQISEQRRQALERRPRGPAVPMHDWRENDELTAKPRTRPVPRLRPPGYGVGRGMGR